MRWNASFFLRAVDKLSERERTIINLRFGLGSSNGEELTQKEVAELLGISQSYISRLEKKIMKRLKRGDDAGNLSTVSSQNGALLTAILTLDVYNNDIGTDLSDILIGNTVVRFATQEVQELISVWNKPTCGSDHCIRQIQGLIPFRVSDSSVSL